MNRLWRIFVEGHLAAPTLAAVVYALTIAPGVYGYDSAELATGAYTLGVVHPTGYPLYLILGKLFTYLPLGSIAFRVNLMSAVFGALTVWMVAVLTFRWTQDHALSGLAGLTLAVTPAFWSLSIVAEVYTLHAFFVVVSLFFALRWRDTDKDMWAVLLGLASGLSLTNHVTSIFYLPAYVAIGWVGGAAGKVRRWRHWVPKSLLAFLAGLSIYLYLPLRDAAGAGLNYVEAYYQVDLQSAAGLLWMVSGNAYRFFAFAYGPAQHLREIGRILLALWHNTTGLGLLFAVVGLVWFTRRDAILAAATFWIAVVTTIFFAGYAVADKMTMLLPVYLVLTVWLAAGVLAVKDGLVSRGALKGLNERAGRSAVAATLCAMILSVTLFSWPRVDKSQARGAETFALQVLSSLEQDSIVVSEWSEAVALEYYQRVEGMRPDIQVFNRSRFEVAAYYQLWREGVSHQEALARIADLEAASIEEMAAGRKLYGTDYDPRLANRYEYLPSGPVFQMVPRN